LQQRLDTALGHSAPIRLDINQLLAGLEGEQRLYAVRAITAEDSFGAHIRSGHIVQPGPQPVTMSADNVLSQRFLAPLVSHIEMCVSKSPQNPSLARVMEVVVSRTRTTDARKDPKQLLLMASGHPVDVRVMHSPAAPPSVALHYIGAFHAGNQGCHNKDELKTFFEAFTRSHEYHLVNKLLYEAIPKLTTMLGSYLHHPVSVEVMWDSIFTHTMGPDERIDVAKTLAGKACQYTIHPMHIAFEDMFQKQPESVAALSGLSKIIIESTAAAGKPVLSTRPLPENPVYHMLVVTLKLQSGKTGALTEMFFKNQVRKVYNLSTPSSDRNLSAAVKTVSGEIEQVADSFTRGFKKLFK
jgi:hypothetical protein